MDTNKVWLVTGASKGLGLSLIKKLLNEGCKVAATSRTVEGLKKEVGTSANFLPLEVNVTDDLPTSIHYPKKEQSSNIGTVGESS